MAEKEKINFVFTRSNYIILLIGIGVNIIGYLLMIGGADTNLNEFNENGLFSTTRRTIAPIVIVLGFVIVLYSIIKKPKQSKSASDAKKEKGA